MSVIITRWCVVLTVMPEGLSLRVCEPLLSLSLRDMEAFKAVWCCERQCAGGICVLK